MITIKTRIGLKQKKISILNFKIDVFLKWIKNLGYWNLPVKLKKKQVNFLLEDIERNLEEYWKATEIIDKQLSDDNEILKNAKTSYEIEYCKRK